MAPADKQAEARAAAADEAHFADPERLAALDHPMRFRIFSAARAEPVSAKELAEHFGEPLPRVSYHVRALADAGLLEPVRRTRRRGAIETHYAARAPLFVSDEAFEALPEPLRRRWDIATVALLADDVQNAIREGANDRPEEFVMARASIVVDEEGLRRLNEAVRDFYDQLDELEKEMRARLGREGAMMNVVVGLYPGGIESGRNRPFWIGHEGERVVTTIPAPDVEL